jgi:hypothetical protein
MDLRSVANYVHGAFGANRTSTGLPKPADSAERPEADVGPHFLGSETGVRAYQNTRLSRYDTIS